MSIAVSPTQPPTRTSGGTGLWLTEPRREPRPAPPRGEPKVVGVEAGKMANSLGWFSLALGAVELVGARTIARKLGIGSEYGLIRLFGAREIATGLGVIGSRRPGAFLWGRVAGDALDLLTLATALSPRNPRRGAVMLAAAAVAGVTLLDVMTARASARQRR